MRRVTVALLLCGIHLWALPAAGEIVKATLHQVQDAWLSSDACIYGKYEGPAADLGEVYHRIRVEDVWLGTMPRGLLVFKAPRGIRAKVGDSIIVMLWEKLNAATDGFLETASRIYGEETWAKIGPDSLSDFLLPFSKYSFPLTDGKLILRGTSVFKQTYKRKEIRNKLLDFEYELLPQKLYDRCDLVVVAEVDELEKKARIVAGTAVEFRVRAAFGLFETLKGVPPARLELSFGSFPRSPRFEENERVILFLTSQEDEYFLKEGKRAVYHIVDGEVAETGQPLREFIKSIKGSSG